MTKKLLLILSLFFLFFFNLLQAQPPTQRKVSMLTQPSTLSIKRLYQLNTAQEELNLSITPDGKYLYFMSTRGNSSDIWYSKRTSGRWGTPLPLSNYINTFDNEDEPNISSDGQMVYFQSWDNWFAKKGPYYSAKLNGHNWTNKKPLGGGIYNFFLTRSKRSNALATDGMTISPDGKTFIMSEGRYYGNMNIYISKKRGGVWSYPKKLNISTPGNDRSPFLAADGKTLYFASDGYTGKGGLDIFKCTLHSNGTASNVVNIGAPFNTSLNDAYFIISSDGQEVYFCRNYDIFTVKVTNSPKQMKPQPTLVISGVITDKNTKKPLRAKILLKNIQGKVISTTYSNASNGEYTIVINKIEKKYYQYISKPTYSTGSNTLNVRYKGLGKNILHANAALQTVSQVIAQNKAKEAQLKKAKEAQEKQIALKAKAAADRKRKKLQLAQDRKRKEIADKQKLKALKEKRQKQPAKACVYKDFS